MTIFEKRKYHLLKTILLGLSLILLHTISIAQSIKINPQINNVLSKIEQGYIVSGVEDFKNLSSKNDLAAQFYLGECFEYGIGVAKNVNEAFRYFRRTAERGLPDAMLKLSNFYKEGNGVNQDDEKAHYWRERYDAKGGVKKLTDLVTFYNKGIENSQNYALNPKNPTYVEPNGTPVTPIISNPITMEDNSVTSDKKELASIEPQQEEEKRIISDIDVKIPVSNLKQDNIFALVMANEDYSRVAPVPNAKRDGIKVKEYFIKTLGIPQENLSYLENATLNDMRYELNRLTKISDAYNGDCSFIVYYSGHGIPDEKTGNGYLLPVDGYGTDITTAYALDDLYALLGNLKSEKTVLITDACFSGSNKEGGILLSTRGVALKTKPINANGNLIVISACQGDETAYSYEEKGHGLLTYFFLKKLQDSKGKANLGEIEEYIKDNVRKTSIVINGKSQTPSVVVSPKLQDSWKEKTL